MKIGTLSLKNNVCMAPMAGITDLVFRTIQRTYGCALCFTEMVSANGLVRTTERSYEYIASSPEDKPLGIQLFGADPAVVSEATKIVTDSGADLIDINMGCPVKKVLKTGAGAALMKEPSHVSALLKKVRKATHLPLTIKIRSGWQRHGINAVDIALIAEECGADAIILHPRTVEQGFSGSAEWELIARVKDRIQIPVVGSGDIRTPEDAVKMRAVTGCDGVMVGRGALGNPWIFSAILSSLDGDVCSPPPLRAREEAIRLHLNMNMDFFGEDVGLKKFRKHLLWYTKGLRGGAQFRKKVVTLDDKETILDAVGEYFNSLRGDGST